MKFEFNSLQEIEILDVLIVPVFKDEKLSREFSEIDKASDGALQKMLTTKDFVGKAFATHLIYPHNEKNGFKRVLFVGLGEKKDLTLDVLRKVVGTGVLSSQNKKWKKIGFVLPDQIYKKFKPLELGEFFAKGAVVASYSFDTYKNKKSKVVDLEKIVLIDSAKNLQNNLAKGFGVGTEIGESINLVRELGNLPPIKMTPTYLAGAAQKLAKDFGKISCKVLDKAEMKKQKMGAMLGVSSGSTEPPKFIILEYFGTEKSKTPVVLVGKGITFDSGGISIKPSKQMDEMKYDMLGGGTVLGAMRAIAALNLKTNVIALIPASENLLGGAAFRPGDILTAANGKTIEIVNTDAEGRLILADALSYASKLKPKFCIDLATLTGACLVALGIERSGFFTKNKKLNTVMKQSAEYTGDKIWQLPLGKEYTELNKSKVADVKNIGGRNGGASTAAAFLQEFVDYPWAHLDIAGTGWNMKAKSWIRLGATGHGVHLLVQTLRKL